MERQYLYDAFISYRHNPADKALAIKLQTLLEQHKGSDGKPLRMFRDQSELPTSGDLGQDITEALEQSRFLIVVCSPSYQESKWCMRELTYFRELHGNTNQNILPILIKGEPREVMPDVLFWDEEVGPDGQIRRTEVEPLCADVRGESLSKQLKLLKTEYMRLAAPILDCGFDDLYQRAQRRRRNRILSGVIAVAVLAGAIAVYSLYMLNQIRQRQTQLEAKQQELLSNESLRLANTAMDLVNDDTQLAMNLAIAALPTDLESPEYPLLQEAEIAMRSSVLYGELTQTYIFLRPLGSIPIPEVDLKRLDIYDEGRILMLENASHIWLYDLYNGVPLKKMNVTEAVFNDTASHYMLDSVVYTEQMEYGYGYLYSVYDTYTGELVGESPILENHCNSIVFHPGMQRFYLMDWSPTSGDLDVYGWMDLNGQYSSDTQISEEFQDIVGYWNHVKVQGDLEASLCQLFNWGYSYLYSVPHEVVPFWDMPRIWPDTYTQIWQELGLWEMLTEEAVALAQRISRDPQAPVSDAQQEIMEQQLEILGEDGYFDDGYSIGPYLFSFEYSPDWENSCIVCCTKDGNIISSDASNGLLVAPPIQLYDNPILFELDEDVLKAYTYSPDYIQSAGISGAVVSGLTADGKYVVRDGAMYKTDDLDTCVYSVPRNVRNYCFTKDWRYSVCKYANDMIRVYDTLTGECICTTPGEKGHDIMQVSIDKEESRLALFMESQEDEFADILIKIVDLKTGVHLESISHRIWTTERRLANDNPRDLVFSVDRLVVIFDTHALVFDLKNPENVREINYCYRDEEIHVSDSYITDDGLLIYHNYSVFLGAQWDEYPHNESHIIDLATGEELTFRGGNSGVYTFCYDEASGTLVIMDGMELFAQRRDENGEFQVIYEITDMPAGSKISDFYPTDGKYLVINKEGGLEIRDLHTGQLLYDVNAPHLFPSEDVVFGIIDGVLYSNSVSYAQVYPTCKLLSTADSREKALDWLVSDYGMRVFSQEEQDAYYILDAWVEKTVSQSKRED